jgi:hypothetical protein
MDAPHRIKVKYFLQNAAALDLAAITPMFHRWIQERRVDGLWLDVADYKHVKEGPGIVLIGHEADFSLDLGGSRPGLVYDRKRGWDAAASLPERVRLVLRSALAGCQALEADAAQSGLRFRLDDAELGFVDRLYTPNQPAVFDAIVDEIHPALDAIYGREGYTLTRLSDDPRRALAIGVQAKTAPTLSVLLERAKGANVAVNGASAKG